MTVKTVKVKKIELDEFDVNRLIRALSACDRIHGKLSHGDQRLINQLELDDWDNSLSYKIGSHRTNPEAYIVVNVED